MPSFKLVEGKDQIPEFYNTWTVVPNFKSKDRVVTEQGKKITGNGQKGEYKIFEKRERLFSTWERIGKGLLGTAVTISTLALGLLLKSVRNLFKSKETVRFAVAVDSQSGPPESKEPPHLEEPLPETPNPTSLNDPTDEPPNNPTPIKEEVPPPPNPTILDPTSSGTNTEKEAPAAPQKTPEDERREKWRKYYETNAPKQMPTEQTIKSYDFSGSNYTKNQKDTLIRDIIKVVSIINQEIKKSGTPEEQRNITIFAESGPFYGQFKNFIKSNSKLTFGPHSVESLSGTYLGAALQKLKTEGFIDEISLTKFPPGSERIVGYRFQAL